MDKETIYMVGDTSFYSVLASVKNDNHQRGRRGAPRVFTPISLDSNWQNDLYYCVIADKTVVDSKEYGFQILCAFRSFEQDARGFSYGSIRTRVVDSFDGHSSLPIAACVTADNTRIVSADEGGTVIVWERQEGTFKEKSRTQLSESAGKKVVQFALAPDGKTVAVLRSTEREKGRITIAAKLRDLDVEKGEILTPELSLGMVAGDYAQAPVRLELFLFNVAAPPTSLQPMATYHILDRAMLRHLEVSGLGPYTFPEGEGQDITRWSEPSHVPASLEFSPDGKTLMAAFGDLLPADSPDAAGQRSVGVKVWELVPPK